MVQWVIRSESTNYNSLTLLAMLYISLVFPVATVCTTRNAYLWMVSLLDTHCRSGMWVEVCLEVMVIKIVIVSQFVPTTTVDLLLVSWVFLHKMKLLRWRIHHKSCFLIRAPGNFRIPPFEWENRMRDLMWMASDCANEYLFHMCLLFLHKMRLLRWRTHHKSWNF